jgi:hypothetical protein
MQSATDRLELPRLACIHGRACSRYRTAPTISAHCESITMALRPLAGPRARPKDKHLRPVNAPTWPSLGSLVVEWLVLWSNVHY